MIFDGRGKYIRCKGFDPILFDLETDPAELQDIGHSNAAEHTATRA